MQFNANIVDELRDLGTTDRMHVENKDAHLRLSSSKLPIHWFSFLQYRSRLYQNATRYIRKFKTIIFQIRNSFILTISKTNIS